MYFDTYQTSFKECDCFRHNKLPTFSSGIIQVKCLLWRCSDTSGRWKIWTEKRSYAHARNRMNRFCIDCECINWVEVNIKSVVTQFIQHIAIASSSDHTRRPNISVSNLHVTHMWSRANCFSPAHNRKTSIVLKSICFSTALCLVPPESWISILNTDSIFIKDFP